MKNCSKCRSAKDDGEFPRNSRNKSLLDSWCTQCRNEASAARRTKDPQKAKDAARKWREKHGAAYRAKNLERYKEQQGDYVRRNHGKVLQANAAWRAKNRAAINEKARQLRSTDERKIYMNAYCRGRQARQKLATPRWVDMGKVRKVYAEARRLRLAGVDVHVDHIIPIKSDFVCGLHWEGNLQILPATDNIKKGNKLDARG